VDGRLTGSGEQHAARSQRVPPGGFSTRTPEVAHKSGIYGFTFD